MRRPRPPPPLASARAVSESQTSDGGFVEGLERSKHLGLDGRRLELWIPRGIVVLERGRRYKHTDFRQSMDIDHLSDVYNLIQGNGAQVVTANAVGGGSNLYLAASLRAPTETFERRYRRPGDGTQTTERPFPYRHLTPQQIRKQIVG